MSELQPQSMYSTEVDFESGQGHAWANELGMLLIPQLFSLFRTARIHDTTNQAFRRRLREFVALLWKVLAADPEITFVAVEDHFYINDIRADIPPALQTVARSLAGEFNLRSITGLRFLSGICMQELERFFHNVTSSPAAVSTSQFAERLERDDVCSIRLIRAALIPEAGSTRQSGDAGTDTGLTERERSRRLFEAAVNGTRGILYHARQVGYPDLLQAKRLVQPIVDSILRNRYSIVGMTALKDHDQYTYAHCVNVSILSIGMGRALKLDRRALAGLGVAGLLHDVGKVAVSGGTSPKSAAPGEDEWRFIENHPLEGARMFLQLPGLSRLMLDAMRVSFEHHMNVDGSGYPKVTSARGQSAIARLVALGDCFDAVTAHRPTQKPPRTPYEGLRYVRALGGVHFDPAVLWALEHTVGRYPPGTMLLTKSGFVVLATAPNPHDLDRPFCRLMARPDGREVQGSDGPERWDPMPADQQVERVLGPDEYEEDTDKLLAA